MEHPNMEAEGVSFDYEFVAEQEVRRLFVMSSRAEEVTKHRDIINPEYEHERSMDSNGKWNGGSPRVFNDNGACGVGDDEVPCCNQTCSGLNYCSALNDRRIEDKYFPTLPFIQVGLDSPHSSHARMTTNNLTRAKMSICFSSRVAFTFFLK